MKQRLFIARPVAFMSEHPDVGTYLGMLGDQIARDSRFEVCGYFTTNQARILDARNECVRAAKEVSADYLLFIDPDMQPDCELPVAAIGNRAATAGDPSAMPFWASSAQFMLERQARNEPPGVIAAPACSGPPDFKVNVFKVDENGERYNVTRKQAALSVGSIEQVDAIGTGVMLIPMSIFNRLPPPYFDDVYTDDHKCNVHHSQDTNFCFQCGKYGIPVFCNWYAWAGHWKLQLVRRPKFDPLELLCEKTS